jgi:hypothetical protein
MTTTNAPAPSEKRKAKEAAHGLLSGITCPHCWHRFAPGQILWVSQHTDLTGDAVAGADAARRFLPSRFTADCQAIDSRGMPCQQLACPQCHLLVPRQLTRAEPYMVSIVGGPSSGKTWLLTSMIWELRRTLATKFQMSFNDADTLSNVMLTENEGKLFLAEDPNAIVTLLKTEEKAAGFYDQVTLAGQPVQLPKPFFFAFAPTAGHPREGMEDARRILCLYDNAGEAFQPGHDSAQNPTTQHLAKSRALFFLYDPTQDPRFREQCRKFSEDPQFRARPKIQTHAGESAMSQHTLLLEAAERIRRYAHLPAGKKYERPLLVVVSKSDVWNPLIDEEITCDPYVQLRPNDPRWLVDMQRVERVSAKLRRLLMQWSPEIVTAAEELCQSVIYIPVSALGSCPEAAATSPEFFGARPRNIKPRWVTVPYCYMFARWSSGSIGSYRPAASPEGEPAAAATT